MTPLTIAEVAQVAYTEDTIRVDDVAREFEAAAESLAAANPLTARKVRHKAIWARRMAAIAYRAARAEKVNRKPDAIRPCGICRGVRACDWFLHLALVEA